MIGKASSIEWQKISVTLVGLLILALGFAWVSNPQHTLQGWVSFWLILTIGSGLIWACFTLLHLESPPSWLVQLVVGAVLLRLGLGVFWPIILPTYGWGSDSEKAGYVMKDAYKRDIAAWELARSDKPLWNAFTQDIRTDQYGGLLFFSGLIYRYFGNQHHQPMLIVLFSAFVSALSVLFGWAVIRIVINENAAKFSAWILAFYPEAVLLGSSQMREPFVMTFAAAAFYGLAVYVLRRNASGIWWLLGSLLLTLLFSPPFVILLLGALFFLAMGLIVLMSGSKASLLIQRVFRLRVLLLLLLAAVAVGGMSLWLSWGQIAPKGVTNLWDLIQWWLRKAAAYQLHISHQESGWLQRELRKFPDVLQFPTILLYGVMRPFLPAAVIGYGNPVWSVIAIWRSLGWTIMLFSLAYATLRLWLPPRLSRERKIFLFLVCLIVWFNIFLSSYRGGGDDWDSPRYRMLFVSLQAGLAGWIWSELLRDRHNLILLRRLIIAGVISTIWFLLWYLRRYHGIDWPLVSLFHTFGAGISCAVLYIIWDCARTFYKEHS